MSITPAPPENKLLSALLDPGEAAVIQLASSQGVTTVLIDERKGRKIARSVYHLEVIGTAGILIKAKKLGLIASVREALERMREGGYWIHDGIVQFAIEAAEEA